MRAESSLLGLCRVQPIGGEANYDSLPFNLTTLKQWSSEVQEFGSSDDTIGCLLFMSSFLILHLRTYKLKNLQTQKLKYAS